MALHKNHWWPWLVMGWVLAAIVTSSAYAEPVHLRCEYLNNPLGIDAPAPSLSWQSDNPQRNWHQTAYQILVASTADRVKAGQPDVWDSGKQLSAESVGIVYGGPRLESGHRYYWTVRVWDGDGKPSQWAEPAFWEMGLLATSDWTGKWIARKNPDEDADRAGIRWIWLADQNALKVPPHSVGVFHLDVNIAAKPRNAALFVLARGEFKVTVNGRDAGKKKEWLSFDRREITHLLVAGKNSIEVTVISSNPAHPSALAALLKITRDDGSIERVPSNSRWEARLATDTVSKPAQEVAELGDSRLGPVGPLPQPAALFRKEFNVSRSVRSARLYVAALGSYRMWMNGQRVGQDVLTPDFTDYRKRVLYQTYDVTGLLASGRNAVGALLGDGWFQSPMTWDGRHLFLPQVTRMTAQLRIDYGDGSHETIATDDSWKTAQSPILNSEIYAGEVYDARLEQPGWDRVGFDDSHWRPAIAADPAPGVVSSQMSDPVRLSQTLQPTSVTPGADGAWIFDLGQNMVGWVALKLNAAAGTAVRMRFAEILKPDGNIYRDNLRDADATDFYIARGGGQETYEPYFTFHGFRYVELTGYPGKPALSDLTGEVISSVTGEPAGKLTTSSDLVNGMWRVGIWGQRGNFLSVPTDCPQRDERLGWMGDAEVFWRTGSYNFDIAAFSRKFMRDVTDAQTPRGAFPNVSPNLLPEVSEGAPGWGDAGVIVPWTAWLQYGDKALVQQNWDAMERWMKYIQDGNPSFLRKKRLGPNFADWLAPDERTLKDLIATAYWALQAQMMSDMASAIRRDADAKRYAELYNNIRAAFQKEWIKEDGVVGTGTQTSYVLALQMKLVPDSLRTKAVDNLVKDIQAHNWHLTTGFLGTPHLLFALADNGRVDVAYRLLLSETYPSWGYMLVKGATTWWERWNGDTGDPAMNSYNHYAFGSVVAWVYRYVAGIDTLPESPGFRKIVIHPRLDARITHARAEYDSVYGKIISDWTGKPEGPFSLHVMIPANTTAHIILPVSSGKHAAEDGKPVDSVVDVGSGTYEFTVK